MGDKKKIRFVSSEEVFTKSLKRLKQKTEEKKKEPVVKKIEGINLVERLLTTEDSTARVRVGVAPE